MITILFCCGYHEEQKILKALSKYSSGKERSLKE